AGGRRSDSSQISRTRQHASTRTAAIVVRVFECSHVRVIFGGGEMKFGLTARPDDPRRVKIATHVVQFLSGKAELVVDDELVKHLHDKIDRTAPLREIK